MGARQWQSPAGDEHARAADRSLKRHDRFLAWPTRPACPGVVDKHDLVTQLAAHLQEVAQLAQQASADAKEEARDGATAKEKRADARVAIEFASLARGQSQRAQRASSELAALKRFAPGSFRRGSQITLGAIVELEDSESGEGRTLFLAPVGAGATLHGPGGDGFLSVVTPSSPIGRAVMGRRVGDVVDITVKNDVKELAVTWVE